MKIKKSALKIFTMVLLGMLAFVFSMNVKERRSYADGYPYMIKVNVAKNYAMVCAQDESGQYTKIVKIMSCCPFAGNMTLPLELPSAIKNEWSSLPDGKYARYATVFNGVCISSVPYTAIANNALDAEQYNQLGKGTSSYNILTNVESAKWIFEKCNLGTTLQIYSDPNEQLSVDLPVSINIPLTSVNKGWDPTDDDPENPWKNESAKITGASNREVVRGEAVNLMQNIKAFDTCGNDITSSVLVMGDYDTNKVGTYDVTYYVADSLGSKVTQKIKLNVKDQKIADSMSAVSNTEKKEKKSTGQKFRIIIILAVVTYVVHSVIKKKIDN